MIHENGNEVEHPKHYNMDPSGVECIEIVRYLNFNVGNALKYIWRAGKKDLAGDALKAELEDVKKAIWYLKDEIAHGGPTQSLDRDTVDKFQKVAMYRGGLMRDFMTSVFYAVVHRDHYYEDLIAACDVLLAYQNRLEQM